MTKNMRFTKVAKDKDMGRRNLFKDHNCWKISSLARAEPSVPLNVCTKFIRLDEIVKKHLIIDI